MIRKALKDICNISTDPEINTENYLDSLNFIDNLYKIIIILQEYCSVKQLHFLPSFKAMSITEKLGIPSEFKENELKIIKVKSNLFLEDIKLVEKIKNRVNDICENVIVVDNVLIFKLK